MTACAPHRPGRRRVLGIVAAGAAALLLPSPARSEAALTRWDGHAFGGEVSLTLRDADRARARQAIADCVAEIERIEQVFSLYRPDSALVRLNAAGHLDAPPAELVTVLNAAARFSAASGGAFDVTVQPLWQAHLRAVRDPAGGAAALEAAQALVGWQRLDVAPHRVSFATPGMAATLNGIAQGYATDRVAGRLRDHGFPHVLVNLGEFRGLGEREAGTPWRIGVGWPERPGERRDGVALVLDLADRAVATSSPLATPLDRSGSVHHLFNPRTGRPAQSWASVTVVAATALVADALATAIAVAAEDAAAAILKAGGGERAILLDHAGRRVDLTV